jgi:hypothetical protein
MERVMPDFLIVVATLAGVGCMWRVVHWIGAMADEAEERARKMRLENDKLERESERPGELELAERLLGSVGHRFITLHDKDGNEIAAPAWRIGLTSSEYDLTEVDLLCGDSISVKETGSQIAALVNHLCSADS